MNASKSALHGLTRPFTVLSPAARIGVLLLVMFAAAFTWFNQNSHNANSVCRIALAANLVQEGVVNIDAYEALTVDKSYADGRFYCDKAPGMSFLGAPAAFAFSLQKPLAAEDFDTRRWVFLHMALSVMTSGLLCALAGWLLYRHVAARTGNLTAAVIAAITFGLGTPVWGWATSFFSHAAAAALIVMGYIALEAAVRRVNEGVSAWREAAAAGAVFGVATMVEYTSLAPAAIAGACLALTVDWRSRVRPALVAIAAVIIAGVVSLLPLLVYHNAAFGSPFSLGYSHAAVFEETKTGFFGLSLPDPVIIGELVAGLRRGFIWYAPVTLAALWAAATLLRNQQFRIPALVSILVFVWFILMNAGFSYWLGGWSTGPRYLTPALGLMALPLGLAWPSLGRNAQIATLVLLGVSVVVNFAVVAAGMAAHEDLASPLTGYVIPALIGGDTYAISHRILGGPAMLHLAALALFMGAIGWLIRRELKRLKPA